ncbi:FAD-binding and (Fe-S)-binding domain-containing protein [Corynebacterium epidermidicanis]|uniref:D-lactate dehydrogenase (cytochrome) n=1 Tax=Corynebacterium epidermidicanis TaxID=1050174 RepID=A0A0G3GMM4_9CORY|nr:FAD-binding and (Fe-S)-binding domain-containing protein [Corynebacterium epidermidicanis]AKK02394.1 FAD/FMN-dependent dehydrogenase [Corynebacterium epidermidicanis]
MAKLLTPDTKKIGQPEQGIQQDFPDKFPEALAGGTPVELKTDLENLLGKDAVHSRALDLVRFASDAGPYRLFPQVVVSPRSVEDMASLLAYCAANGRHLTYRSGGSSLNGQCQGDDILVDTKTHFRGIQVEGERVRVRPGETLAGLNAVLARHGRRFAPDPASAVVATIGGILSNNSGGMRCTVDQDSYHSIVDATLVLPSGTVVDTADPDADARLAADEPELVKELLAIREEIVADEELVAHLRRKFSIRNTNGLRLDAFLDGDTPVEILRRLLVGAEGTLGFIAEAVLDTQPLPQVKAVTWVMLPTLAAAAEYVPKLMDAGAAACELLVSPVLRESVGHFDGADAGWAELDDDASAILLEVAGLDEDDLQQKIAAAEAVLAEAPLTSPLRFMRDATEIDLAWQIRGGLFALLGKQRQEGTALITEDVCFPPALVGEAAKDLMKLLAKYDYPESVMGHAAFGNLHFFMTPAFGRQEEIDQYDAFINELVELVIDKYSGSLKAEHGTGMNMAPFLLREWGEKAYQLMWRVKEALDPQGILAPDVKLTRQQDIHLQNFKSFPRIEEVATHCVECGFCEPVCPSRNATVTPRQRIVLRREMARQPAGSALLNALYDDYGYDAIDMCAADGTCSISCPISIDTGVMMKQFRAAQQTEQTNDVALKLAKNWAAVEKAARGGLTAAGAVQKVLGPSLGSSVLGALTGVVRSVVSEDLVPSAQDGLPPAASALPKTVRAGAAAIYFPACINRMFGRSGEGPSLPETLVAVSARAGKPLHIPGGVSGTCCGTPFSSKGFRDAKHYMSVKLLEDLWLWSEAGTLPIVVDASSCTHGMIENVPGELTEEQLSRWQQIQIMDAVQWAETLLPSLSVTQPAGRVAVHPNCSLQHMDLVGPLMQVASFAAEDAFVPLGATCCGTAGDRGLLHPELLESATADERVGLARAAQDGPVDAFVSANRTCEMGLEQSTGHAYEHVAYLLDEATR